MATATAAPPAPPRPGILRRASRSEHAVGWAFVSPAVLIIGIFGLLPILWSLLLSFQKSDLLTPQTPWVGLQNYKQIPGDATFRLAIEHTIIYTALFVPCTMVVGLVIAAALNRKVRGISIYRTAAYVTMAVSTINEALVFMWLFEPSFGVVNAGLQAVGIPQQQWLSDPNEALYVIVAMTVWGWTGFAVVIYLAALQGVPQDLQDAAAIDGAKRFTIFRTITFPLLSPATLFLAVWLSINALQLFDEVYLTTRGGPLYSTTVIVYYLYDQAFQQFNAGYAAALAYVLFMVIVVITFIQFRIGNRFVHYNR
ncbi:MAG TPA: sugar ABC transporter permease [Nocardioidaceae bacterium]|jgi:multiple sugar transport system permease protein|nr:sugar ABC transporter permease [Nocardioidaceae bacterium]